MRSGGPAMTVTRVNHDLVPAVATCRWFEGRGRPHYYYLEFAGLELAEPDGKEQLSAPKRR